LLTTLGAFFFVENDLFKNEIISKLVIVQFVSSISKIYNKNQLTIDRVRMYIYMLQLE